VDLESAAASCSGGSRTGCPFPAHQGLVPQLGVSQGTPGGRRRRQAALRETQEETGLEHLNLHGPIRLIDWHFRFRGRRIHKYCHFFLLESPDGDAAPQTDEGITAVRWCSLEEALEALSYDNARGV
jgi:8-oxo-dGTP pyrophosphatase MutT (NUDIX family)